MALPQQVEHAPTQDNLEQLDLRLTKVEGAALVSTERLRVIRGIVNTTDPESIEVGTGFSISRTGVGAVTVTFDTAFSDLPVVTFGASGDGRVVRHTALPTASTFAVQVRSVSPDDPIDDRFHFMAIGPR